jgi:hypothetical protein
MPEFPLGVLEALTSAFGRQIQRLMGTPATRLTADLTKDSVAAGVETTLAFPATDGAFWTEGRRFEYTAKTDVSFTGLTTDRYLATTIPAGTLVVLDLTTAPPE